MRSEGSVLLQKAPGTQAEKARKLGVTQGTVSRWETGKSAPRSYEDRDACRRVYGIPLEAWARPASSAIGAQPPA
ncbi:helix-turn-helix transcriptional regulator [Sorangium sp. So ce128]|uniref:helix-turn-helix transcriptional regulator n=1 Tax=Sorangium sp. So ce128 TaxID=3133281 RepID=UPI003F61C8B4